MQQDATAETNHHLPINLAIIAQNNNHIKVFFRQAATETGIIADVCKSLYGAFSSIQLLITFDTLI